MITGILLLCSYVSLALGVYQNFGFYTPVALAWIIFSFLCLLGAGYFAHKREPTQSPSPVLLACALLFFLVLGARKVPGMYLHSQTYAILFFYANLLLIPVIIFFYLIPRGWKERMRLAIFCVALLIAFGFRGAMPLASPAPAIDVFVLIQESARHLLSGLNPYTTTIPHVTQGQEYFGYHFTYYHYPPASLYLLSMGYLLLGDARYTYVACEFVIAFALWTLARRRMSQHATELLVLLFLYHPRNLFILEQAWTEPLILFCFALVLLFRERGRDAYAAASYGYMISLKQYLIYFVLHWLMIERRRRFLALGMGVTMLTFMPFVFVDGPGFWHATVSPFLEAGFRRDSLSISAALYHGFGASIKALSGSVVGALAATLTFFAFRKLPIPQGYLFAVIITTFSMFLFGNLAFANYYYFVGGLLLLLMAMQGHPFSGQSQKVRSPSPQSS